MAVKKRVDLIVNEKGADKAAHGLGRVDKSLIRMAASAVGVTIAVEALKKAFKLGKLGASVDVVRSKFEKLADQPSVMLAKMKEFTAGTIDEMTLMQKFNQAALLGLPLDRFDEMLLIARGAAQATGESMEFMLNSIVTGIGRQSRLMIDNLGLIVSVGDANEAYAEKLGKQASALSEVERKQAFANAVLEAGMANIERMGGATDVATDAYSRLESGAKNLAQAIGETLNPVFSTYSDLAASAAKSTAALLKSQQAMSMFYDPLTTALADFRDEIAGMNKDELADLAKQLSAEIPEGTFAVTEGLGLVFAKLEILAPLLAKYSAITGETTGELRLMNNELFYQYKLLDSLQAPIADLRTDWQKFTDVGGGAEQVFGRFADNLADAVVNGQKLGDAVVSSLKAIAAQLVAKAALYAILYAITGGTAGAIQGGLLPFVTGIFTGGGGGGGVAGTLGRVPPSGGGNNVIVNVSGIIAGTPESVGEQIQLYLNEAQAVGRA